ncbi:MAG: hypothetical protein QM662_14210 [Gordonia sp. (in: high G+C Gram-positive bacteria)]
MTGSNVADRSEGPTAPPAQTAITVVVLALLGVLFHTVGFVGGIGVLSDIAGDPDYAGYRFALTAVATVLAAVAAVLLLGGVAAILTHRTIGPPVTVAGCGTALAAQLVNIGADVTDGSLSINIGSAVLYMLCPIVCGVLARRAATREWVTAPRR